MCTTAQTRAARSGTIDRIRAQVQGCIETMLTIAVLVAISVVLIVYQARVAGRRVHASLGWMSAQWVSEYRASHPW